VDYPDQRDQIVNLQIKAESIQGKKEEPPILLKGLLLAKAPVETRVSYGDRVLVVGFLKVPPEDEDFNYREYLFRQSIDVYITRAEVVVLETGHGSVFLGAIYRLKTKALKNIYRLWPDPEASLLAGILLGVESGISESVQKAFRDTGTTHIIAISGFNITIVAGFFSRFFSRIMNPRKGAFAALAGISIYTILVGADAAVVRAAVMGGLSIFAQQIGRRQHGLNAAALASLVMMLFNPQLPWDVSFQLSLSATLGLVLYADPLSAWFLRLCSRFFPLEVAQRITQPVSEFVLFCRAADHTAGDDLSLPLFFPDYFPGKSSYPAGTTAYHGAWRIGFDPGFSLVSTWQAGRAIGISFCVIYHPGGGMVQQAADQGCLPGAGGYHLDHTFLYHPAYGHVLFSIAASVAPLSHTISGCKQPGPFSSLRLEDYIFYTRWQDAFLPPGRRNRQRYLFGKSLRRSGIDQRRTQY